MVLPRRHTAFRQVPQWGHHTRRIGKNLVLSSSVCPRLNVTVLGQAAGVAAVTQENIDLPRLPLF